MQVYKNNVFLPAELFYSVEYNHYTAEITSTLTRQI